LKILLVRLRLVGDVVFTTPIVRALRRRFPDAHLTYVVESRAAPVVARSPHIDEVMTIEHARGWRRLQDDARLAWRLRSAGFDLAIDFHGGPRSAWLTWASRAPARLGYDVAGRAWMYTHVTRRPEDLGPRHSVQKQWDLLALLEPSVAGEPDRERDRVEMPVDPSAREAVAGRLAAFGVPEHDRVIVIHVSAGNQFRRWPESSFAALVAGLVEGDSGRWVILTGGPSDSEASARIVEAAAAKTRAGASRILLGEDLSLADLRALVDRAALFIGGDSGPLHVAATSDVKIVGVYGPSLPGRSEPWRPASLSTAAVDAGELPCRPCDQRSCAPGDYRCLTMISAAAVQTAAERLLEGSR
jgi:predicted lipopolysaccharide heptosyltransferase III